MAHGVVQGTNRRLKTFSEFVMTYFILLTPYNKLEITQKQNT